MLKSKILTKPIIRVFSVHFLSGRGKLTKITFFLLFIFAASLHTFMLRSEFIYQNVAHSICVLMVCFNLLYTFLFMNCKFKFTTNDQLDT